MHAKKPSAASRSAGSSPYVARLKPKPPLETAIGKLRRAYVVEMNVLYPRIFAVVRKHPSYFAECSWGVDPRAKRHMANLVERTRLDAQWFRIFVWHNARRVVKYGDDYPCPDVRLLPRPTVSIDPDQFPKPLRLKTGESNREFFGRLRREYLPAAREAYGVAASAPKSSSARVAVRVITGRWSQRKAAGEFGISGAAVNKIVRKFRAALLTCNDEED